MSRGSLVREEDEKCAVYALGSAINMAAIEVSDNSGVSYEQARADVTECLEFMLRDFFLKDPRYGLPARKVIQTS